MDNALLASIRECDELEVWRADGCRSMAEWIAARFGISRWLASRWIRAAHALVDLPSLSRALETGCLPLEKTVELARFATPDTERKLIKWATKASLGTVRQRGAIAETKAEEELEEDDEVRYLRYEWTADGRFLALEGLLPARQGAVVEKTLDRLAQRVPVIAEDDDGPSTFADSVDKRCADALYMVCSNHTAQDADADRATVVVHVDLDALISGEGESYIENGPQIYAETARTLACDCRMEVVWEKEGTAVGIERASRNIPRRIMRALRHRDKTCTFPGCSMWRFVHGHHVKWWTRDQGPTNLDNLILVCPFHHQLLHERGWVVTLDARGRTTWFRPNGEAYAPAAEALRLLDPDLDDSSKIETRTSPKVDREREPNWPRLDWVSEPLTWDLSEVRAGPISGRQPIGAGVF